MEEQANKARANYDKGRNWIPILVAVTCSGRSCSWWMMRCQKLNNDLLLRMGKHPTEHSTGAIEKSRQLYKESIVYMLWVWFTDKVVTKCDTLGEVYMLWVWFTPSNAEKIVANRCSWKQLKWMKMPLYRRGNPVSAVGNHATKIVAFAEQDCFPCYRILLDQFCLHWNFNGAGMLHPSPHIAEKDKWGLTDDRGASVSQKPEKWDFWI